MKKPLWENAPIWANYTAMDDNGDWFWYENEPELDNGYWVATGKYEHACVYSIGWKESLEPRP